MLKPDGSARLKPPAFDGHPEMAPFFSGDPAPCRCPKCGGPARWSGHLEFARDLIVLKCPGCGMLCRGRDDGEWRPYPDT